MMSRHSRQGFDDSPGRQTPSPCCCVTCDCPCNCPRVQHDSGESIEDDYTLIDSDNDSVNSGEPEDLNQPDRAPALEFDVQARDFRPLFRYAQAAPSHLALDESTWMEVMQFLGEIQRLRQESPSQSMEASFISSASPSGHDDRYERPRRSGSMMVEVSTRSPASSMESSMYMSFSSGSSRQSAGKIRRPIRSNSGILLEGIGALFDQPNWFTASPLKLGPDPEYCFTFAAPTRSLSLPAVKLEQRIDASEGGQ